MQYYLKNYKVTIHALSPIHIGSGEKIGKKEYIYLPRKRKVIVPDINIMYGDLRQKRLDREFESFMMRNGNIPISKWLADKGFNEKDFERWKKYEMDTGEAFLNSNPKEIECFVKDAYGIPYVPGSSIKGMFRTAIIAMELTNNHIKASRIKAELMNGTEKHLSRNTYLLGETRNMESEVLNILGRDVKSKQNAVNDCLSGLIVGDSQPIDIRNLTLSQKIDYTLDGQEKPLPILRESLIPDTNINFEVTIDKRVCPYDIADICSALNAFADISNNHFYKKFHREITDDNAVFLGGGCGFLSKTIIYNLFDKDAVYVADKIFKSTLGKQYDVHKHRRDISLGVAPHVCKCTRYGGRLYNMGIGKIEVTST